MEHSAVATVSRPSLPRFLADHVAPAMLWILFTFLAIWGLVSELREDPSGIMVARNLLSTVFVGLMMVLFLLRYSPKGRRGRPAERLVAIGGTFVFFFLAFAGEPTKEAAVIAVGVGVDVLGLVISIVALATLGRCFGLFPEARGLVTRAPVPVRAPPALLWRDRVRDRVAHLRLLARRIRGLGRMGAPAVVAGRQRRAGAGGGLPRVRAVQAAHPACDPVRLVARPR